MRRFNIYQLIKVWSNESKDYIHWFRSNTDRFPGIEYSVASEAYFDTDLNYIRQYKKFENFSTSKGNLKKGVSP